MKFLKALSVSALICFSILGTIGGVCGLTTISMAMNGTLKGEKGDQGVQGIQGEKGDKGDKGTKGEPGVNGLNGTDGKDAESPYPTGWYDYVPEHKQLNVDYSFRYRSEKIIEYRNKWYSSKEYSSYITYKGYLCTYSKENTWYRIEYELVSATIDFSHLYSSDIGMISSYWNYNSLPRSFEKKIDEDITKAEFDVLRYSITPEYLTQQFTQYITEKFDAAINNTLYGICDVKWEITVKKDGEN